MKHKAKHSGPVSTISWTSQLDIKCRVDIGMGSRLRLRNILGQMKAGKRVLILAQPYIAANWFTDLMSSLISHDYQVSTLEVPDGEACKSTDTLLRVWSDLQDRHFERKDTIVAMGGGAVCDLAGFVASTYLRGLNLVSIPTSLLAQVDAAIGGKTAINLPGGKNLAGTFYFPRATLVDPQTLSTLPTRQFKSGLAEMIKYALIEETVEANTEYESGTYSLFDIMNKNFNDSFNSDNKILPGLIASCIKMKLAVANEDPYESSLRRCLNLGHTLGHAIESASHYKLTHGEAVSIGLCFAFKTAVAKKRIAKDKLKQIESLLKEINLPTEIPEDLSKNKLIEAMGYDKKHENNLIKFVLPQTQLGQVDYEVNMSIDELASML